MVKPSIAVFDSIIDQNKIKENCLNYIVDINNVEALVRNENVITLFNSFDFDSVMTKIIESRTDEGSMKDLIIVRMFC